MIRLHMSDLSLDTLRAIKEDLQKYSHLRAYEEVFGQILNEIANRTEG